MKSKKIWGTTTCLNKNAITETHFLHVVNGGFCSKHVHRRKTNYFYVIAGRLLIRQWERNCASDLPDRTILGPGESLWVPFGMIHQFEALEECWCIEIYEFKWNNPDIERFSTGGVV